MIYTFILFNKLIIRKSYFSHYYLLQINQNQSIIKAGGIKNMFINERQQEILNLIKTYNTISVEEICKKIYASPATVRRDLTDLELHGLIRRVWGGASIMDASSGEISSFIRQQTNVQEKKRMAHACIEFLKNDSSYFFDSSSTVSHIIPLLKKISGGIAITNGLCSANALSNISTIKSFMIGGEIQTQTGASIGGNAVEQLANFYCDVCFFSCHGFSLTGPNEGTIDQQKAKAMMIRNSKLKICLVDHTKFNKQFFIQTCSISDIDVLITDKMPEDEYLDVINKNNVRLIVV